MQDLKSKSTQPRSETFWVTLYLYCTWCPLHGIIMQGDVRVESERLDVRGALPEGAVRGELHGGVLVARHLDVNLVELHA